MIRSRLQIHTKGGCHMSSKTCIKCRLVKTADGFYRNPGSRDGRAGKCIECTKADVRRNRLEKIEHYRAYDRKRAGDPKRVLARENYQKTDAFRISHAISAKRWDVANAIRKRASSAVNNAIRNGRLVPQPCFLCGRDAQAHHPDYSAPLAVTWLCPEHHAQTHKEHRAWIREAA